MATLFTVDLEEGDLTGFDSTTGTGLSAIAPGLVASVWCMAVANADANARYGQIAAASDKDHVRLFFSLDPFTIDALVMANNDIFTVLLCQDNSSNDAFRIELGYTTAAGHRVRPGIYTDGAAWSNGAWVAISTNEHFIEVEWKASSAAGADDGSIKMWVDVYGDDLDDPFSSPDSSVASVDNDMRAARVFRLGAPAGLDAGTSGTLWLDHLVVNDDGAEIGHPGVLAFADAEGAGRFSVGGREGTVYIVSNTNNSGAGSFREACSQSGPTIVVFTTDGTIQLTNNITITNPYISIYGQTAPSDGICLRDYTLRVRTHDVIIQHIRSRPGDTSGSPVASLDSIDITNDPTDAADVDGMVFNVILDHCSVSWSSDENIAVWNENPTVNMIKNITVQWCILAEGLYDTGEGRQSMGSIHGGVGTDITVKNVSIHHSLYVHNRIRNPLIAAASCVEFINNIMHGCTSSGYICMLGDSDNEINYVGNTASGQGANYTLLVEPGVDTEDPNDYYDHQIYVDDNIGNYYIDDAFQIVGKGWGPYDPASAAQRAAWEADALIYIANSQLTAGPRSAAYEDVLDEAGCFPRDDADARVVQDVRDDDTGLIDSQADVGGWPTLDSGSAGTDTDGDGMPDDWEDEYGLDKDVADDDQYDLSVYWTNIEMYANPPDIIPPIAVLREPGASLYELRLFTAAGGLIAKIISFEELCYTKRVNSPGLCTFKLDGDHTAIDQLEHRSQVEVWRANPNLQLDEHCDFYGLYLSPDRFRSERSVFTTICPGQMWFLSTRIIAWYADTTARTVFTDAAETIMKTLVDYNACANATTGNGRLRNGAITGLSIQADGTNGYSLHWHCAWKNLLTELQDLAQVAGGDFDLIKTGAQAWEFRWYTGQRGNDRRSSVVFAHERGNMINSRYLHDRMNEKTVAIVGGQGEKDERDIEIRTGDDYGAANDVEAFVDAKKYSTTAGYYAAGDKRLSELRAREAFSFEVVQTPSCFYGQVASGGDYELGDLVTARAFGIEREHKIIGVTVTVIPAAESYETIDIETETPVYMP